MAPVTHSLFDRQIVASAIRDAFRKLTPRHMLRNPVMFVVLVGAALALGLAVVYASTRKAVERIERGYRFFIDHLMRSRSLSSRDREARAGKIGERGSGGDMAAESSFDHAFKSSACPSVAPEIVATCEPSTSIWK